LAQRLHKTTRRDRSTKPARRLCNDPDWGSLIAMNHPFSKEHVLGVVTDALSRVLGLRIEEIAAGSSLVEDLGAESLDFVELNAMLEKGFGLTLPSRSVLDHAGRITGEPERFYHPRTGLTEEGVALLAASPYRYLGLKPGTTTYEIFNTSTVGNLANICHEILCHLPQACPDCGGGQACVAATGRAACADCGAPLKPLRGDDVLEHWLQRHLAVDCTAGHR